MESFPFGSFSGIPDIGLVQTATTAAREVSIPSSTIQQKKKRRKKKQKSKSRVLVVTYTELPALHRGEAPAALRHRRGRVYNRLFTALWLVRVRVRRGTCTFDGWNVSFCSCNKANTDLLNLSGSFGIGFFASQRNDKPRRDASAALHSAAPRDVVVRELHPLFCLNNVSLPPRYVEKGERLNSHVLSREPLCQMPAFALANFQPEMRPSSAP
ncbi:hypothetical protein F2P81_015202 [Scophthalmus maximus]|uniref:Uncharacterized protein n=1 Tax=Scophthalmus maximus TaxID=52904 RepID=A0A6A4SRH3_SCOMX|nr:hypothetical protein F2P81_015202 [Scophthalmus maximus]